MSRALYLYTLKAAIRDRMVHVIIALFVIISALSVFMGGTAVFEELSFTLVFASSSLRIAAVLGVILFITFYIQRSFASKDVDFILSHPLSRENYIISQALAFMTISLFLALAAFIAVFVISGLKMTPGITLWGLGLFIEIALMANIAMFFSMVLKSAVACFASSFGFYILSRMSGAIFGIIDSETSPGYMLLLERVMELISVILPRLDLIVQSQWLLYGVEDVWTKFSYAVVVAVIFSFFIILAAIIDLKRKEF